MRLFQRKASKNFSTSRTIRRVSCSPHTTISSNLIGRKSAAKTSFSISRTEARANRFLFIPLAAFLLYAGGMGLEKFLQAATDYRNVHAYAVSFGCAFAAAVINCIFGLILAWVLVRYEFKGKRIMDALIDLPFALPTAVAGIALTTLYAETGWIGQFLAHGNYNRIDLRRHSLRRKKRSARAKRSRSPIEGSRPTVRYRQSDDLPSSDLPRARLASADGIRTVDTQLSIA